MYVSAPVRAPDGEIVGVVSVGKPVQSLNQFVAAARRKTMVVGATSVAAVLVLALILSLWLVRPFGLIADYVRYVRSQRSFSLPRLGRARSARWARPTTRCAMRWPAATTWPTTCRHSPTS
jgi:two-component system sensor histidine kinase CreC